MLLPIEVFEEWVTLKISGPKQLCDVYWSLCVILAHVNDIDRLPQGSVLQ